MTRSTNWQALMGKTDSRADVDDVFRAAARAIHPRDGPFHVLQDRVARLEARLAYLTRRIDVLVDLLLAEGDRGE